jgi:2-polyprenyl-6-methoxyphenol hydroxylase-like FAD-dependent oxidoreductase
LVDTDVLVVGAGPVGLVTALTLSREGLGVRVIDQYQRSALHSYALALHPGTLRLLGECGLAESLIDQGRSIDRIGVYHWKERVGELDLARLGGPFPRVLLVPQVTLEGALEDALRTRGVQVSWNHQAMSLESDDEGVTTLVGRIGDADCARRASPRDWGVRDTVEIRSSAVVGADGYFSTIRRLLGARYISLGKSESFCLFEFESDRELEPEIRLVFHDDSVNVLWPIGKNRGRWNFQIDPEFEGDPDVEVFRSLVAARAPWFSPLPERIEWSTTVAFNRRLVDRFGEQRVWLAGEAAHLTGPIGVHNMNIGMCEGGELAGRFGEVLHNGSSLEPLEHYAIERQTEWLKILAAQDRLEPLPHAPEWARELGGRLVDCVPASGVDLSDLLGQIGLRLE